MECVPRLQSTYSIRYHTATTVMVERRTPICTCHDARGTTSSGIGYLRLTVHMSLATMCKLLVHTTTHTLLSIKNTSKQNVFLDFAASFAVLRGGRPSSNHSPRYAPTTQPPVCRQQRGAPLRSYGLIVLVSSEH